MVGRVPSATSPRPVVRAAAPGRAGSTATRPRPAARTTRRSARWRFRQAYAGTELVSRNGKPWAFLKEISSDGNMQTIDVTYPAMPVFLYADPAYLGLMLAPILDYVENHALPEGRSRRTTSARSYPNADGHLDGTGEEDMPVEESANMLIMAGRLPRPDPRGAARRVRDRALHDLQAVGGLPGRQRPRPRPAEPDRRLHRLHRPQRQPGAEGHHRHRRDEPDRRSWPGNSPTRQAIWPRRRTTSHSGRPRPRTSSGKHLKLAYDQDGTWSLKYNGYAGRGARDSAWCRRRSPATEADWYLTRAATDGIPLDIRHGYTKARLGDVDRGLAEGPPRDPRRC